MTDSNAKNGDTKSSSTRLSLPALPGAEAFQHQTTAWGEQAVDLLTQAQLIQSANGEESPAVSSMIDTPLDMLPELPLEHPRYETRRSERLKVSIANERNRLDRLRIIYAEWDTIYSALALAAKVSVDWACGAINARQVAHACPVLTPIDAEHARVCRADERVSARVGGAEIARQQR